MGLRATFISYDDGSALSGWSSNQERNNQTDPTSGDSTKYACHGKHGESERPLRQESSAETQWPVSVTWGPGRALAQGKEKLRKSA